RLSDIQATRRRARGTKRTTAIWVAWAKAEMPSWTRMETRAARATAGPGRFHVRVAASSTGNKKSAPRGSVAASDTQRAKTHRGSATGRASRNSFSGEPASTASLLAALAVKLPNEIVRATTASAVI